MIQPGMPDDELQAYVDGRLDPAHGMRVAAWLGAHPDAAAQVAAWRLQKAMIVDAFAPVVDEPMPARLLAAAAGPGPATSVAPPARAVSAAAAARSAGPAPASRSSALALAAALLLGIGLGLGFAAATGWTLHGPVATMLPDQRMEAGLAREAAIAHVVYSPEIRHPVEVAASDEAHLVGWLSKRLGRKLSVPRLDNTGFELVGGRLLPGDEGPAAQFMYQDAAGRRLTLYVRVEADAVPATAFRFTERGTVRVFHWVDGSLGYALSGELGRDELLAVATNVHRQLGT